MCFLSRLLNGYTMIFYTEASIQQLSIHKTGNKLNDDPLVLSDTPMEINDEVLSGLLMQYLLNPFEKVQEIYRLYHPTNQLGLNEIYHFAAEIFAAPETFHQNTQQIARHLYDIASHARIKPGELYLAYFSKVQVEGEITDAIGIFKSETKEPYLKVAYEDTGFQLMYEEQAINIKKLDKGCIIFNTEKELGYKVAVTDQTNRTEAVYWVDDFLKLKIRNDAYTQTQNTLSIYKTFVTEKMDEEFELNKADKIDLLNRSIDYFKGKESFNFDEFANEVIGHPQGAESFKKFKSKYEVEFDTEIADSFDISEAAVKKQARVFKSVLKLDRNFHIYIHGSKDLIEKGYDEQVGKHYYKIYFNEES
jgi:hypothetical protein